MASERRLIEVSPGRDLTKVTPELPQVMYLDEIAGRLDDVTHLLQDILNFLESTVTVGIMEPFTVPLTTDKPKPVQTYQPWYECTIYNDGPDAIKISTVSSQDLNNSILYYSGDSITIHAKKGSKNPIWLQCPTANASARVVFKR